MFAVALATSVANAVPTDAPYQTIIRANVFRLRPFTLVAPPTNTNVPLPSIIPNGIFTVGGKKLALFKVQSPSRPPLPASERLYILAEGQREDEVEVVAIDEKAGAITFKMHDALVRLTVASPTAEPIKRHRIFHSSPPLEERSRRDKRE